MSSYEIIQIGALVSALAAIVFLVKRGVPLILAMGAGVLILGVSMYGQYPFVLKLVWEAAIDYQTFELALAVGLIFLFGYLLGELEFLKHLHLAVSRVFRSKKIAFIIIPSLIGFLPVMGGAVISAPLVNELGEELGLSNVRKSAANLVFRHCITFISPFSPALILLSSLTGIDLPAIIKTLLPIGVFNIIAGYVVYLKKSGAEQTGKKKEPERSFKKDLCSLIYYSLPLTTSFSLLLFLRFSLVFSILAGIVVLLLLGEREKLNLRTALLKGPDYHIMLGMIGIMVFRAIVSNLSGLYTMVYWLKDTGWPPALIFIIVPLFIGWVSASTPTMVALTATILYPLLQGSPDAKGYIMLMFTSGFVSYFISPIHLCQILSNRYFGVSAIQVYKEQYFVLGATYLAALIIFGLGIIFK